MKTLISFFISTNELFILDFIERVHSGAIVPKRASTGNRNGKKKQQSWR